MAAQEYSSVVCGDHAVIDFQTCAYQTAVNRGQEMGRDLLREMMAKDMPFLLGWKVKDLTEKKMPVGVLVGLCDYIARAALCRA